MFTEFASWSGLIASLWIVLGVAIAGKLYGSYSHINQLCSELGAAGSRTEKISPVINNYPLAVLFCIFGWFVLESSSNLMESSIGWLIIAHGVGTLIAGYFPMDADPYTETPTTSCNIHSAAGVVMLLSLIFAPVFSFFTEVPDAFKYFTGACLFFFFVFTLLMASEYKAQGKIGLYQRLSYGAQLVWLAGYSVILSGL